MANKKAAVEAGVIALATVYQDGKTVRGKIPASVVRALKAKDGDVVAFESRSDGDVVIRKSTAAERKGQSRGGGK